MSSEVRVRNGVDRIKTRTSPPGIASAPKDATWSFPAGPDQRNHGACPPLTAAAIRTPIKRLWLVHYDDIRVGSIAMRAGVPADKDQWGWSIGFYPATDRGLRASGTAKTFDAAPAAFDMA